ncbi:matrixin family metalloprotease [bacterium]|nr:matrixin family metalloprotease [bacterium]
MRRYATVWITLAFLHTSAGAEPTASSCPAPPEEPVVVDPGDTYLQPSAKRDDDESIYIHVTEADMPWVVSIATPKRPPRYGSRKKAREVSIEAMRGWERAIHEHLPWFRLEFVEDDPNAAVQIVWKRRMTGSAAGRGGQRWKMEDGCLRVGGFMNIATRSGPEIYEQLTIDELELLVAHEFGHVLGLKHCLDCDSAMNYSWQTRERIYVTDLDVRTFLKLVSIPNGATAVRSGESSASQGDLAPLARIIHEAVTKRRLSAEFSRDAARAVPGGAPIA